MPPPTGALSDAEEKKRYPVALGRFYGVDELLADPRNARVHNRRNLDVIKASLEEHGQRKNIVVDATGLVRAGNGTLAAAKELGWTKIYGGPAPEKESKARAYALVDNRSADLSYFDNAILGTELGELVSLGENVEYLGWTETEAMVYLGVQETVETGGANEWEGMPEFDQENKESFRRIVVHFKDQDAVNKFSKLMKQKITEATRYLWFPEIEIERYADKRYGK